MKNLNYINLYRKKHENKVSYGRGATYLMPQIILFIDLIKCTSILDYGCGKGDLVRALQIKYPNMNVVGYDPAVSEYAAFPYEKFDFIICTDVLEHIPENELNTVIEKMSHLSSNIFFHLHHAEAAEKLDNGENAHCTIKPREWYHDLFKHYFNVVYPLSGYLPVNSACCTFSVPDATVALYEKNIVDFLHQHIQMKDIRIKQSVHLLSLDFNKILLPRNTVFYGYTNVCRIILSKIKNKGSLLCVLDKNAHTLCQKKGGYDLFGIPVMTLQEFCPKGDETIVIFPTWEYEVIVKQLRSFFDFQHIYRAEDFFR
ncbi:MAG: methyltransferase domain-containing protein [Selenomonadaceae bacterium]|nr:methyltransferase domain-containing protein [Selenomonadaceae bacterium]